MFNQEFLTMFKDYLPILSGLITLTSAGFFGYLLQHVKNLHEATSTKTLIATIELKDKLKSAKKLEALDELRLNKSIDKLKHKAVNTAEYVADGSKYLADKVLKDLGAFALMGLWILALEISLYAAIINAIIHQSYWFLILIITIIATQTIWETRKAKHHLQ